MTIATLTAYKAALRETPLFVRRAARAGAANQWFTLWDATGSPAAGTLAIGNTANGLVPTDATTGAPTIIFTTGTGYLMHCESSSSNAARYALYDRLFHAGAYSFDANITLAAQPSFASRAPGGSNYAGLQLWVECVTTFTGSLSLAVTYTDQDGNTGATTGTIVLGVLTIGQMVQMPLAAGDNGLRKVESIIASVASIGTFNVLVARPLWSGLVDIAGGPATAYSMESISMPQVFGDSCLVAMMQTASAVTPVFELAPEIASA